MNEEVRLKCARWPLHHCPTVGCADCITMLIGHIAMLEDSEKHLRRLYENLLREHDAWAHIARDAQDENKALLETVNLTADRLAFLETNFRALLVDGQAILAHEAAPQRGAEGDVKR